MPVLNLPAPTLANLAMDRAFREDIGTTAIWHYPAKEPKGKLLFIHGFRGDHHGLSATAGALVDRRRGGARQHDAEGPAGGERPPGLIPASNEWPRLRSGPFVVSGADRAARGTPAGTVE